MLNYLKSKNYFIAYQYIYIFLMPWDLWKPQIWILTAILTIWWLSIAKENNYFLKLKNIISFPALIVFIFFLIYSYISLLWTQDTESAFYTVLRFYKYYFFIIPIFITTFSFNNAKKGIYIFLFSLSLYALYSIGIYLNIFHIVGSNQSNPKGIMAYAIVTPYMAIATLSFLVLSLYAKNTKYKYIFIILAFLSFIALVMNNGRAAQVAFFITIILLLIINYKYIHFNIRFISLGLTILFVSFLLLYNFHKLDRYLNAFNELKNTEQSHYSGSWGNRLYLWYPAIEIIKKHPIIGMGAGDTINALKHYEKVHPSKASYLGTFHNQHLDTLTRFGIIGYILLWGSVLLLIYQLKGLKLFFNLSVIFFSITFFDGIGDIILLMKPYNNVFIMIFTLYTILAYKRPINAS